MFYGETEAAGAYSVVVKDDVLVMNNINTFLLFVWFVLCLPYAILLTSIFTSSAKITGL